MISRACGNNDPTFYIPLFSSLYLSYFIVEGLSGRGLTPLEIEGSLVQTSLEALEQDTLLSA